MSAMCDAVSEFAEHGGALEWWQAIQTEMCANMGTGTLTEGVP